ncbi:TspO/MBR family protein [Enterococcus sp. LJL128]
MKVTGKQISSLIACIIGVELVGSLSGLLAGDIRGQYAAMTKPPFSPPGSWVGIIWIVLYFLIGVSLYLLITADARQKNKQQAILLFVIQLMVNFIWSLIFFGGEYMWIGAILCLALAGLILLSIVLFYRVQIWAARLFIPYFLWICFASYLSIGLALLN